MLGVILGGRIWYMLFYDAGLDHPHPLASFPRLGRRHVVPRRPARRAAARAGLWSRRHSIHFFDTVDFVAPLVPIGLGLGRLGNFISGELWGSHTDGPWGIIFPGALEGLGKTRDEFQQMYLAGQLNGEARHPSQLYEFALEGVVMFTVLFCSFAEAAAALCGVGTVRVLYGVFRFAVEFVRVPDAQLGYLAFGWLTMGQMQSLPLIASASFAAVAVAARAGFPERSSVANESKA